ncbi:Dipeptide permease D [Novipirellula galeiformis]|uniref:Dipeptide permease D n=1 Tax=Novipirellula galeiformis TaxID=2528004 RepID=A0A5C6CCA4_9BACT|nr:peptide MFS transporter [Novipirellula galeiformis]TWU22423.1 Dipeptide permease D [Novipirellula galeiformis]
MSADASANPTRSDADLHEGQSTLFGHPTGLYTLFFAEMWERFSYYGMRALLILYMIKGFLKYGDEQAYTVYGAYTALVYMTPFFGGMLADRILGQRRAVILGAVLMSAGHLLMTYEAQWPFFVALSLLIVGNGFFKPNISTIVGTLYPKGSGKRDGGFTIFYMGINLGAAMSPLLCGYIGETYGWHYGFGLATFGMLAGLAVFVMPTRVTQGLIALGAIASAGGMLVFRPDNPWTTAVNVFVAIALLAAGTIACIALSRGGLSADKGRRPEGMDGRHDWKVYLGTLIAIPILTLLVSGFSPLTEDGKSLQLISNETIADFTGDAQQDASAPVKAVRNIAAVFMKEISKPAGLVLTVIGVIAFGYLILQTFQLDRIPRQRMIVALVLIFFQMLFFAFFEQAGSSVNLFTDRNVDRVVETEIVTDAMVGQTVSIEPTQEQIGYEWKEGVIFSLSDLDQLRAEHADSHFQIDWTIRESNLGMGIASRESELPTSLFQSVNPIFILLLGLVFSTLWTQLRMRNLDPSSPVKFALGLTLLGIGFGAFWYGAVTANGRGMVTISWLLLGYMLQTMGELCLSPVGLSTMTKLSPRHLVSTVMGGWFLATAFSQYLAAIISQLTGVSEGGDTGNVIPLPTETVHVYGGVFGTIAITAILSGLACLILSPWLSRWMHEQDER